MVGRMRVAGKRSTNDWQQFRRDLLSSSTSPAWLEAPMWIRERIDTRFLDPVALILKGNAKAGEGFSIVAIDCILMEFLEALHQGKTYRYRERDEQRTPHEYGSSRALFKSFLTTRARFQGTFDQQLRDSFYSDVRCGLLHEAATKSNWLVKVDPTPRIAFIEAATGNRVLNRVALHEALSDTVADYCQALPTDQRLQEAFLRVMDHTCALRRTYLFIEGPAEAAVGPAKIHWQRPASVGERQGVVVEVDELEAWNVAPRVEVTTVLEDGARTFGAKHLKPPP
jgi:hypothetical protein